MVTQWLQGQVGSILTFPRQTANFLCIAMLRSSGDDHSTPYRWEILLSSACPERSAGGCGWVCTGKTLIKHPQLLAWIKWKSPGNHKHLDQKQPCQFAQYYEGKLAPAKNIEHFFEDIAGDSSLINFIRQRVNIVARWGPRVVFIGLNSPHEYYRYIYIYHVISNTHHRIHHRIHHVMFSNLAISLLGTTLLNGSWAMTKICGGLGGPKNLQAFDRHLESMD